MASNPAAGRSLAGSCKDVPFYFAECGLPAFFLIRITSCFSATLIMISNASARSFIHSNAFLKPQSFVVKHRWIGVRLLDFSLNCSCYWYYILPAFCWRQVMNTLMNHYLFAKGCSADAILLSKLSKVASLR